MNRLKFMFASFLALSVFYVLLSAYTLRLRRAPPQAPLPQSSPRTDWIHQPGAIPLDERSFEARFPSQGGWAVSERCRRPISVLVFVYTAPPDWRRRAVLRDTLSEEAAAQRFNWTVVFFTGQRQAGPLADAWVDLEVDTTGDLVQFPFEDTYAAVSTKFVAGMRWVAEHCPAVEYVIKIDDDELIEPFQTQKYLERMMPLDPRSLHCYVWRRMHVDRNPKSRFFESYEDFPDDAFFPYCSGRAVIMTFDVMRDLLRAASVIPPHPNDDAYVTGDLALAHGIGHVNIHQRIEGDVKKTDCIYNGSCFFTHDYFTYGLTIGRRSGWGLLLWRQRLDAGETLDLSTRLQSGDYVREFNRTRTALLEVLPTTAEENTTTGARSTTKQNTRANFSLTTIQHAATTQQHASTKISTAITTIQHAATTQQHASTKISTAITTIKLAATTQQHASTKISTATLHATTYANSTAVNNATRYQTSARSGAP